MSTLRPYSHTLGSQLTFVSERKRSRPRSFSKLLSCCSDQGDGPEASTGDVSPAECNSPQASRGSRMSDRRGEEPHNVCAASTHTPCHTARQTSIEHEGKAYARSERSSSRVRERDLSPLQNREATWWLRPETPAPKFQGKGVPNEQFSRRETFPNAPEDKGKQQD
jgi:hypothetical protein